MSRARLFFAWLWPLLLMAAIYGLSSVPGVVDTDESAATHVFMWTPPAVQNLLHVPLFALLAWLWHRALTQRRPGSWITAASALLIAIAYGTFDEWHQLAVPGRYASLTDLLLNALGGLIGILLAARNPGRRDQRA